MQNMTPPPLRVAGPCAPRHEQHDYKYVFAGTSKKHSIAKNLLAALVSETPPDPNLFDSVGRRDSNLPPLLVHDKGDQMLWEF